MKDAAFVRGQGQLRFRCWPRSDIHLSRNDNRVHAQSFQAAAGSRLLFEQISSDVRIDFAVDRELEFARDSGGEDRAVAVDEMQRCPHRSAARPNGLSDWPRLRFNAISKFRWRIDAEVKSLRIERLRFCQLLRKIVLRDAAVRRNAKISRE